HERPQRPPAAPPRAAAGPRPYRSVAAPAGRSASGAVREAVSAGRTAVAGRDRVGPGLRLPGRRDPLPLGGLVARAGLRAALSDPRPAGGAVAAAQLALRRGPLRRRDRVGQALSSAGQPGGAQPRRRPGAAGVLYHPPDVANSRPPGPGAPPESGT